MRKKRTGGFLAAALLATSLLSAPAVQASGIGTEVKIGGDALEPDISVGMDLSKDYAVWVEKDDSKKAVVIFNRDNSKEEKVADDSRTKSFLKVADHYAAWIEESSNRKDIYLYDISLHKTTKITDGTEVPTEMDFDGSTIVWTDKRNGKSNIYAYKIKDGSDEQITTSNKASAPTVSKGYVAWQDQRNGNSDIYYYDLTKNTEKQATSNSYNQENPSIDSGVIVYEDSRKGIKNIYSYDISDRNETAITNQSDDSRNPVIYDNYVVFAQKGELKYVNLKNQKSQTFTDNFYTRSIPAIYDNDVLYVTREDGKYKLNLYDLKKEESAQFGSHNGDPAQPDASDKYVVFVNQGKHDEIVLYDVATANMKVISGAKQAPSHPVVSNSYAVWYDDDTRALFAYDIKKQSMKQVTKTKEEPSENLFDIDGNNLFWIDESGRDISLNLTNLSTGKTSEIETTGADIKSVDIKGNHLLWVTQKGKKNMMYYVDLSNKEGSFEVRHDAVEVGDAHLADDFIVWSEKNNDWDIFYYEFSSEHIYSLLRNPKKDQVRPQASHNFIMFETNEYSRDNKFEHQFYDLDDLEYSDINFSDEADPSEIRLGGDRIVWIDKRDDKPELYTMQFAEPKDDDGGTDPGTDPGNQPGKYTMDELVKKDELVDILLKNDPKKVVFIFNEGTSKEIKYTFDELAKENSDKIVQLFLTVPFDKIMIEVLP
ncbi:hypothetical protein ACQCN2_08300 [Brevibacillus ginsengisoli]|uniref:TolB family protein n=1 Tax=Brevibacillus ginsengisoli TaxID=363854 RepID=UPI003CE81224